MIVNRQRRVPVAVKPLEDFFERVRRELRFASESVTVELISDAAMARLNRSFRNKRGPTDVLSFPANGTRPNQETERVRAPRAVAIGLALARRRLGARQSYVGDIAISPETARRNARRFSRTLPAEMRILILHGMIHLAGFDHENDHGEMDRLERRLRRRLGVV
jgi:probable rRNA maturation factor